VARAGASVQCPSGEHHRDALVERRDRRVKRVDVREQLRDEDPGPVSGAH
jgi:hypothetical protein